MDAIVQAQLLACLVNAGRTAYESLRLHQKDRLHRQCCRQSRATGLGSKACSNPSTIISSGLLGLSPKLYSLSPRVTGSPNDGSWQIVRSGGCVCNTDAKLPHYPYGGPAQQLVGRQSPDPASLQPSLHPQQNWPAISVLFACC